MPHPNAFSIATFLLGLSAGLIIGFFLCAQTAPSVTHAEMTDDWIMQNNSANSAFALREMQLQQERATALQQLDNALYGHRNPC